MVTEKFNFIFISLYLVFLIFFILLNTISKVSGKHHDEVIKSLSNSFSANTLNNEGNKILVDKNKAILQNITQVRFIDELSKKKFRKFTYNISGNEILLSINENHFFNTNKVMSNDIMNFITSVIDLSKLKFKKYKIDLFISAKYDNNVNAINLVEARELFSHRNLDDRNFSVGLRFKDDNIICKITNFD